MAEKRKIQESYQPRKTGVKRGYQPAKDPSGRKPPQSGTAARKPKK